MKKYFKFIVIFYLLTGSSLFATTKSGTTVAQFLKIGINARTMGMGESGVANSTGLSSLQYNPACLARFNVQEITFSQSKWLVDTDFMNFSASMNFNQFGVIGLHVTQLDYGDEKVRTINEPTGNGEYWDAQDLNIGISYAKNLTDKFSIGGQFKFISQQIWHMKSSTMAIDLGALFITPFKDIRLGMSITNFGGKMMLEGRDVRFYDDPDETIYGNNDQIPAMYELNKWPIPLTFRVGLAGELIDSQGIKWTLSVDALHPSDNSEYLDVGTELGLFRKLYLRAGMRTLFAEDQEGGLSMGIGIQQAFTPALKIKVDYAWIDYGVFEYVNMLSVSLVY